MKVFIACLGTETNTFAPMPTGWTMFEETMLHHGDATQHPPNIFSEPLHVWRKMAEEAGMDVVESVAAFAQPAGITVRRVYEGLRDELLTDLKAAMPVDMVLLSMHGAMVAEGYEDCEGDLLSNVRAVVGREVPVGGELDLHCSVTPTMMANVDVLITFKEYPHIDGKERAVELFDIVKAQLDGKVDPVMAVQDCRMVNLWPTTSEAMAGFVAEMQAAEKRDGVLSVSFAHSFPWGDVPCATAKVIAVCDGDQALADGTAKEFADRIWDLREETATPYLSTADSLVRVRQSNAGPMILADVSDNPGCGAPGDSTYVLAEALDAGMTNIAIGLFWDPVAVRFCKEAGEGARIDLRVGGKSGRTSGQPVDVTVTVRRILEDVRQSFGTASVSIGDAVWVQTDDEVDLVLISVRSQALHPDAFTQLGIDLASKKAVIVKSTQHFHAGFAPIGSEVIYMAPEGAVTPDFAAIPFQNIDGPYWPRVDNPFDASAK